MEIVRTKENCKYFGNELLCNPWILNTFLMLFLKPPGSPMRIISHAEEAKAIEICKECPYFKAKE